MQLGVGVTSINPVVAQLIDLNLVEEKASARNRGVVGRPRSGLHLVGSADTLAIVIWGHGVLDLALARFDQTIAWRRRTAAVVRPELEDLATAIEMLFAAAEQTPQVNAPYAIVVGLPAPYERGVGVVGKVSDGDMLDSEEGFAHWFHGDPMKVLSERFGVPVLAENDANLGALGESRHRSGQFDRCVVYLKLSSVGIGSGITINGKLFGGSQGFAGEIAHVRVDNASTVLCVCGSRGCLEEKVGQAMLAPLRSLHGEDLDWDGLLELLRQDNAGAIRVVQDAGRLAGRALADISTFMNPSLIVVDAGSPIASAHVLRGVSEQIEQSAPPFIRRGLRLETSVTGDDAALFGAIDLARVASIGRADADGGVVAKRARARRVGSVRV